MEKQESLRANLQLSFLLATFALLSLSGLSFAGTDSGDYSDPEDPNASSWMEHAAASFVCPNMFTISGMHLPYCADKPISTADNTVANVIIVIHGMDRTAASSFSVVKNTRTAVGATDATIVAPQFLISDDIDQYNVPSDILYWTSGWKSGDISQNYPQISSYAVTDEIIRSFFDRSKFPNVNRITVIGHSAGGQFTNRYAAGNQIEQQANSLGIAMRYVVANPSSYIYFSSDRPKGTTTDFAPLNSSQISGCPGYNTYKYGLDGLNIYMAAVGAAQIKSQYQSRQVTYLLGMLDTDPNDSSLDVTCPAELQGAYRLERGKIYYNYLGFFYGPSIYSKHTISYIEGVGHSSSGMFNSDSGRIALFGDSFCYDNCNS